MSDDESFYTPGKKPPPPKYYRAESSERLWELRKDLVTWSCDLRFHGESYGWEAMIFRDGEFVISQRFAQGGRDPVGGQLRGPQERLD